MCRAYFFTDVSHPCPVGCSSARLPAMIAPIPAVPARRPLANLILLPVKRVPAIHQAPLREFPMITESRTFVASFLATVTVGAFVLFGTGIAGNTRAVAAPTTLTLNAVADTYVSTSSPNQNFGSATSLAISKNSHHVLLRFDVSVPDGSSITNVGLRVYSKSSVNANLIVHPSSNAWAETTVTAANRPVWQAAELSRSGTLRSGQYASATLPASSVTGGGNVSFGLNTTAGVQGSLSSRETGQSPQLLVTYSPPSTTPAPTLTPTVTETPTPTPPTGDSFEFAAVGDMNPEGNTSTSSASGKNAAEITASLDDGSLDNFIGLGDFQYNQGTCSALGAWNTLWGGVKAKTFWTAGPNHDVEPGVNDDVDRFMDGQCVSTTKSATSSTLGRFQDALEWYSFDKGNWHIVVAPTAVWRYNATRAQAMTSEMDADMKGAKAAGKHLAVVYHDPYFTSDTSSHTRFIEAKSWIDVFWANRVKVLLSGSQHNYERTCPVNISDQCVTDGMQQFQVSTGGIGLRSFLSNPAYVEKKFSDTWGHLRMSLKADGSYTWEFRPVHGGMQTDSGSRE